ncbi:autotransporter domain-containing protein [Phenylobacterium sp.]|uniref:autotransporter family protein n=1 Tax=Phenylobacterium sp. TaxID=1871053 RepID=UPI002736D2D8|nr:autotransporter domain-containing protein [Phenylobacterium sp.]MDP3634839.1 autotransporter domain-containing protein [Phenylobacterium sp.]
MKNMYLIPPLSLALAALSTMAVAREVVVLPGVVSPVGVASGVDTQGPGTLTVGAQDINTGNDAGGGITTSAANTANIRFNNNSTVTGFVGATGSTFLNIAAGANGNTVTFNGPVYATTFTVTGSGTVNFNRGFTSNTGSTLDFAGDGFVNVGAGQTVKAALTNTAGANTGTLTLNSGSIFDGAVGAASGLKLVRVSGGNALITGQVKAGTYTLDTNTLNVAGAFAIPVAGTINTTIFSPSLYGKIVPVGAATIGDALKVMVTVTGPIANGTSFNIVDATSGTTGSTVTATSNTLRYAFSAAPTVAGQVRITTTQIPLVDVVTPVVVPPGVPVVPGAPVVPVVPLPPAVSPVLPIVIAPVIDALPVTSANVGILTAITLLPSAPAIAAALAQLGPGTANLASPQVAFRATQRFQDLWASNLQGQPSCAQDSQMRDREARRAADASACQVDDDRRPHLWMTGFGYERSPFSSDRQGDVAGYEGNESRIAGAMVAYDAPIGDNARAGLGLRYALSSVDGNNGGAGVNPARSHGNISSYQATAYVGYAPGAWFLNGSIAYGFDDYSGFRHVAFTGVDSTAVADYSGSQFTAFATTGYHFGLGDGRTVVTPYATLQYTDLRTDAYTETGDPSLNLKVAAQQYDFLQSGLGVKISRDMPMAGPGIFRPEIHGKWLHSMSEEMMTNTATFESGGPAFTVNGLKADADTFNVGAGFTYKSLGAWSVGAGYDYLWRTQNYSAHQLMVSFLLRL